MQRVVVDHVPPAGLLAEEMVVLRPLVDHVAVPVHHEDDVFEPPFPPAFPRY